jgi:hypothetical protein
MGRELPVRTCCSKIPMSGAVRPPVRLRSRVGTRTPQAPSDHGVDHADSGARIPSLIIQSPFPEAPEVAQGLRYAGMMPGPRASGRSTSGRTASDATKGSRRYPASAASGTRILSSPLPAQAVSSAACALRAAVSRPPSGHVASRVALHMCRAKTAKNGATWSRPKQTTTPSLGGSAHLAAHSGRKAAARAPEPAAGRSSIGVVRSTASAASPRTATALPSGHRGSGRASKRGNGRIGSSSPARGAGRRSCLRRPDRGIRGGVRAR